MTQLLVSVRNVDEARFALSAGVDLIDLKEPSAGSLSPVAPQVWNDVAAAIDGRVPLSAALGELLEVDEPSLDNMPATMAFAKVGLAGCAALDDWSARWRRVLSRLPSSVRRVAVAYADWQRAAAPDPRQIIDHAQAVGCTALLLDTHHKDRGGLLDLWTHEQLVMFLDHARGEQLLTVVGGSLSAARLPEVLRLDVDVVAVRGAACRQSRSGPLEAEKILELVKLCGLARGADSAQSAQSRARAQPPAKI